MNTVIQLHYQNYQLHNFRPEDIGRINALAGNILEMFTAPHIRKFLSHKRVENIHQATAFIQTSLLNQHSGISQLYFISDVESEKTIGLIEVISPEVVFEHYRLDSYPYFVEFCMSADYQNKGIMGYFLDKLVQKFRQSEMHQLGAVADPRNGKAVKTLEKAGLKLKQPFDGCKNLYTTY